MPCVARLMYVT